MSHEVMTLEQAVSGLSTNTARMALNLMLERSPEYAETVERARVEGWTEHAIIVDLWRREMCASGEESVTVDIDGETETYVLDGEGGAA